MPHLASDARFTSIELRARNRNELLPTIVERFKTKTTDEHMRVLKPSGLACAKINSIENAYSHPQVRPRRMIEEISSKFAKSGRIRMTGKK